MKVFLVNKLTSFYPVIAAVSSSDAGKKISESFQWLIAGGGLLLAIFGIVQITQSGRQGDSQGKMEGSWSILGGILLLGLAAGTMITGIFSNPPGL
ncbi:hypothetical protein K5E_22040 [Enterococcus thailandicus]|uniref:hypothetical protein n=1 Tax=Enterococcus thailandicus TaxID=417368 RepID=UPI00244D877A|nr:hypothetical protein [Enterococcus thailandicus]GMC02539.1 hypothetical protein K4E_00490 [Enterococcus thailandicus]GMC10065.1 hypothetical protein K5E_22040 [Enterococcus thailandicus]